MVVSSDAAEVSLVTLVGRMGALAVPLLSDEGVEVVVVVVGDVEGTESSAEVWELAVVRTITTVVGAVTVETLPLRLCVTVTVSVVVYSFVSTFVCTLVWTLVCTLVCTLVATVVSIDVAGPTEAVSSPSPLLSEVPVEPDSLTVIVDVGKVAVTVSVP